jgi:AcrR family transcriptional regulator
METVIDDRPCSRREARRQSRRDAILAVAYASFREHGYAGTTMSAIAAALGGSKGTLWSYFPSKEELFAAVLDQATTAFRARLSETLDPCGDLEQTLRRFCHGLMGKVTSSDAIALHRLVIAEAGRLPEVGRIFYDRAPRQTHRLLAQFLSGAMERGQLRQGDPLVAARLLTHLCMAGCHQQLLMGMLESASTEQIEADIDNAVSLFLRANVP